MNSLSSEVRMSLQEVAESLGCDRETVRAHIAEGYPGLIKNGVKTFINEEQATYVKLRLERSGRNDLQNVLQLPKSRLEKAMLIKQAMQFQEEEILDLKSQLESQKHAVDFFNAVTDSKDAISIGDAAKVLDAGIGRNKLFEILRSKKILRVNNRPYQAYIDRGWFRVVEQRYQNQLGETRINIKTLIYQKGIDAIMRLI